MAGWDRLESMGRAVELTGGLEARVADPFWMLARQWQVGEFRGDDAAQPAGVRVRGRSAPLATFRSRGDAAPVPYPAGTPLEVLAEVTPEPDLGPARLFAAARAGGRLARTLRQAGLVAAADALRVAYPLAPTASRAEAGASGPQATAILVRRAIDGVALARATPAEVATALGPLPAADAGRATAAVDAWRDWYRRRGGMAEETTWDDERMEYSFSLGVRGPQGEVVLNAPEHPGDTVDWYTFDLATGPAASHGLDAATLEPRTLTAVPTPIRYPGMPASRWWECEDAAVSFGEVDAGPADLARLLVAEFATAYSNDWFVVPITVPVGSLTELAAMEVIDTFGGISQVPSAARADQVRTGTSTRTWRLFELLSDEVGEGHPSPWLFVPPVPVGIQSGPVLEAVALARDEGANLAWGVERLVEGALGRAVDRAQAWDLARPAPAAAPDAPPAPREGAPAPPPAGDWWWRYRLDAEAPPWWIPLVAERIDPATSPEVRLRRARMQSWSLLDPGLAGAQSMLLDPRRPRWLYEEEVPKSGVRVERSWQLARWHDGSVHVWLQRRKRPGGGQKSSGVRWDLLELLGQGAAPEPPAEPAPG